jgi:hypothetical protein
MDPTAPLVFSHGWASGVNAYLAVALYGILGRSGVADAPAFLERTEVIAVMVAMFAVEFVVDKVPYLDSMWDVGHTAIRPAVGSALGVLIADDAGTFDQALAGAGSGATSFASHAVKASIRLAVNTSPEPFTNIGVSLLEDLAVAGVTWLAAEHPWIAFSVAAVLLVVGATIALLLLRLVRAGIRRLRAGSRLPPQDKHGGAGGTGRLR